MARVRIFSWLMLLLVALASLSARIGISASPTVKADSPPKPHDITGKAVGAPVQQTHTAPATTIKTTTTTTTTSGATQTASQPSGKLVANSGGGGGIKQVRANTAEKLKRGLTNFMNNLNPAPYFVPAQLAGNKLAAGSQAEPATIVNDAPTADVLIKGPNRLVQARPLGGPLRWGRR